MEFVNATYLWGLLGLLVPIAIHLWSRKKVVTIKVGSIKLLQASEPKQTSSVKINEWWLLFLRLLTILLVVLILSEPSITSNQENARVNYLIEPSLIDDYRMASILDTIPETAIRVLEKGFPSLKEYKNKPSSETPKYWQLAQEMHTILADSIVVFSKGLLNGVNGIRPSIPTHTKWVVFESEATIEKTLAVTQKKSFIEVVSVSSDAGTLRFIKDSLALATDGIEINAKGDSIRLKSIRSADWMSLQENSPIQVAIMYNDSLIQQARYLRAAYKAISRFLNRPIQISVLKDLIGVDSSNFNTIVLFRDTSVPNSARNLLIYKPDQVANQLIAKGPTKNTFYLTRLLDSENIVSEQLPEKLLGLLGIRENLATSIQTADSRVLTENELQPSISKEKRAIRKAHVFDITPWLWLLFAVVAVVERIISKLRKQ